MMVERDRRPRTFTGKISLDLELFCSSLRLSKSRIRATSVAGCKLPGGADTKNKLGTEIESTKVFVGLLTTESIASQYVLFELGARWGMGRSLIPLVGPGVEFKSVLKGPLDTLSASKTSEKTDLQQLLREVRHALSKPLEPSQKYHSQLEAVATHWVRRHRAKSKEKPPEAKKGILPANLRRQLLHFSDYARDRVWDESEVTFDVRDESENVGTKWHGVPVEALHSMLLSLVARGEAELDEDIGDAIRLRAPKNRFT